MFLRLVAHAHRPHAAVARQMAQDGLGQLLLLLPDAVQRLDVPAAASGSPRSSASAGTPPSSPTSEIAVQRPHHEERVAQPAVAVVPVAAAAGRLGDAGGHRGDDGAGVLEQRELQRDGGRGSPPPATPAAATAAASSCASSSAVSCLERACAVSSMPVDQRLVRSHDEVHRPVDDEESARPARTFRSVRRSSRANVSLPALT